MQPLKLTLKGFRGIRDGLGLDEITLDLERLADGAELIAIAGPNGSGKSTIIDNLVPYLALQSRAANAGPGGFSYYEHVYLPESLKDLTWAHDGRCYRSQIVIRVNGRRRTEAFLHALDESGQWRPMRLDDGTVSDGRVETYTRCVESVCGSAETFFTSVFAAQGKRQLSTFRNAEIKTLLADLLGQDEIRALGQKAGEVARLLKTGLASIRQDQARMDDEARRLSAARQPLEGAAARVVAADAAKQAGQAALDAAQIRLACLVAEREQSRATEVRRAQLATERGATAEASAQNRRALLAQDQAEQQRQQRLGQRVAGRLQRERSRRQTLLQARQRCLAVRSEADAVEHAIKRLSLAQHVKSLRGTRVEQCRERVQARMQWEAAFRLAEQKVTGAEREAGRAVLKADELSRRFGLTGEVPCAGTDLQGRCKLLGDAREARALIPDARLQVARLAREKDQAEQDASAARQQCEVLATAPQALAWAEHRSAIAHERADRFTMLASKQAACEQARLTLVDTEREWDTMAAEGDSSAAAESTDERAEREQIAASRQAIAEQLQRQERETAASVARLDRALAALPATYDERWLMEAGQSLTTAREALTAAERALLAAVRDAQTHAELTRQEQTLAARQAQVRARGAHVENELGNWNLFARCMSNDGLIALAIDDAGPALSSLANELLLNCYGPRFTVAISTLLETGKGEQKEGFDIVVHDGETDESKSVALMSGGERTWVEACLTRAIALYLAQNTGRRYSTLFTDEADGALDPERKRMFMAMKREVLRLGGYEREFFVSQTPELTAMADAVIDLDALRAGAVVDAADDECEALQAA